MNYNSKRALQSALGKFEFRSTNILDLKAGDIYIEGDGYLVVMATTKAASVEKPEMDILHIAFEDNPAIRSFGVVRERPQMVVRVVPKTVVKPAIVPTAP
jgi:hypothetical protein